MYTREPTQFPLKFIREEASTFGKCCCRASQDHHHSQTKLELVRKTVLQFKKYVPGTFLVVQWLRIHLPRQGTQVQSLVQEDPTRCKATKPVHNYWAHMPQLLKPACLEPVLCNKRSHCNEKPTHRNEEWPPLAATRESPRAATKTQHSQK